MITLKKNTTCFFNAPRRQRGSALVITLWVVMILSVIALTLGQTTRMHIRTMRYRESKLQTDTLARAAVFRAAAHLAAGGANAAPVLRLRDNRWFQPDALLPEDLPYNMLKIEGGADAGSFSVEIIDESGKLDVNTADAVLLERLFTALDVPDPAGLAHGIETLRASRPGGRLIAIRELLDIADVDEELLFGEDTNNNGLLDPGENDSDKTPPDDDADGILRTGVAACLTTSPHPLVSVNRAPAAVLAAALGLTREQIEAFEQFREFREFRIRDLEDITKLEWVDAELLETLEQFFTTESDRFTVRAAAKSPDGAVTSSVTASLAFNANGRPVPILWQVP